MTTLQAIIIAIVEGITEFLPISSTAHMIFTEQLLGIKSTDINYEFVKLFTIVIQLGAILSVVALFWKKFFDFKNFNFYLKLAFAVVPALLFGKLFGDLIDTVMEKPIIIACIMFIGGILFLFVDKWFNHTDIKNEKEINFMTAIRIGCFQCLAVMFPGLSRSAATIIGGMSLKLTRSAAAEFSFFLAVPTMLAATTYKTYKYLTDFGAFSNQQIKTLAIGNIVAFVVALLAIKFFINFLKKYGFKVWGWYRIIVGLILLTLIASNTI
jgi:undecaprenyl-diphosphatase